MWWLILLSLLALKIVYEQVRSRIRLPTKGKAVFITGCDSGFGKLTSIALASMGQRVFSTCLTKQGCDELTKASKLITPIICDVTKEDQVEAAYKAVKAAVEKENIQLWGVVNNAGIADGANLDLSTMKQYRNTMEVNFLGVVCVSKYFLPLLKKSRGRYVNIASIAGRIAAPGMSAYCASKFAVEAFSDSVRAELYPWGIEVSVIEPGFMRTGIVADMDGRLDKMCAALPKETFEEYGQAYFDHARSRMRMVEQKAADPTPVVHKIIDALFTVIPKTRYVIGRDAFVINFIYRLPARFQTKMSILLDRGRPLPASVLKAQKNL